MNKEAYDLGVQMALQDCGLVKQAAGSLAGVSEAMTQPGLLQRLLGSGKIGLGRGAASLLEGHPGALAGAGALGGGALGYAQSDEGEGLEGALRGAGVGAMVGGGAGMAGRYSAPATEALSNRAAQNTVRRWEAEAAANHGLSGLGAGDSGATMLEKLFHRPRPENLVRQGMQGAGGLAGLGAGFGLNALTGGYRD